MRRAIHRMEQDIIRLEQEVYRLNKILSIVKKLGLFTQEKDDRLFVYFKLVNDTIKESKKEKDKKIT